MPIVIIIIFIVATVVLLMIVTGVIDNRLDIKILYFLQFQEFIELQSAAVAESEADYAKKKGKKPDYAKFESRDQMREIIEKDKTLPKGLRELLEDDELWALYKPTGHEVNMLRALEDTLPEYTLPDGFQVRSMAEITNISDRAAVEPAAVRAGDLFSYPHPRLAGGRAQRGGATRVRRAAAGVGRRARSAGGAVRTADAHGLERLSSLS